MTRFTRLGWLGLGALLLAAATAAAGERPHKVRGTGHFTSATEFVGEGYETHLGHFDDMGNIQFTPTDTPGLFQAEGTGIHTADNGDQLFEILSGQLDLLTGVGTVTVTYVGGTGRFTDASGSATLSVQMLPDGTVEFAGEGTIDY